MTIDKSIIRSACMAALHRFRKERSCEPLAKFPDLAIKMKADVIGRVWNRALESIDAYNFKEPAANAEAAVAACIHAGLDKFHIDYTNNLYLLRMEHLNYRVCRELSGFTAFPLPPGRSRYYNRQSLALSKDEFADFLFAPRDSGGKRKGADDQENPGNNKKGGYGIVATLLHSFARR